MNLPVRWTCRLCAATREVPATQVTATADLSDLADLSYATVTVTMTCPVCETVTTQTHDEPHIVMQLLTHVWAADCPEVRDPARTITRKWTPQEITVFRLALRALETVPEPTVLATGERVLPNDRKHVRRVGMFMDAARTDPRAGGDA